MGVLGVSPAYDAQRDPSSHFSYYLCSVPGEVNILQPLYYVSSLRPVVQGPALLCYYFSFLQCGESNSHFLCLMVAMALQ